MYLVAKIGALWDCALGRQPNHQKLSTLPQKTNRLQPYSNPKPKNEEPDFQDAHIQRVAKDKYKGREDRVGRYDRQFGKSNLIDF